MPPVSPPRRPRRLAHVWVISIIIAAMVVIYAGVVSLYAIGDHLATIKGCTEAPPSDAMLISLVPQTVDAAGDRLGGTFTVLSFGPAPEDPSTGFLLSPVTIIVSDNDGPRSFTFPAGVLPSPQPLRLITDGFIERWPFDSHTVDVVFFAYQTVNGKITPIDTVLCGSAHVPGWNFTSATVAGTQDIQLDGHPVPAVQITATRSSSTIAFGIVILALMVVMPVLSLTVAILAYRGRRKVEATLMSWMAAMLFATIPLRTFLPGAPPIGSWVDFVIVLWVLVALVLGLVIYVAAWVRWTPPAPAAVDAGGAVAVVAAASASPSSGSDHADDAGGDGSV